ncbi:polysialyltransferase family glycosyltransferase [Microbacterium sp. XT11]|uniref:polysialyltransferase family glycosyltransferase n=1 Tax=Microbacterium sp. XT11 TaxID=367477 RepID=UPI0007430A4B|nr:polysialyltransferase family glycosyltransferase [Microbacterium sp. XT11]ALX65623.1 hypothetical protein AB663_000209 [Microbacterium sp. XT11]
MTQVFALHSAYGLATASAAIDAGLLPPGERVLVPFHSARVPETSTGIARNPALASLRARFDRVEDLDALLGPLHPSGWTPDEAELPLLSRLFARAWRVDPRTVELFVQSPQVAPARTLLELFPGAPVTIVGDGLMTYSPLRVRMPHPVAARIVRVVYADVVPGVRPLAGSPAAACVPVPPAAFRTALEETDDGSPHDAVLDRDAPTALVLGQYLAALGLMTADEELALQERLIDRALEWSPRRIVFRPHPSAPPQLTRALRARAEARGVAFAEHTGAVPAELLARRLDARVVVAGFSTALPTVRALYGIPIASAGTRDVLARLAPFENSNRIPATIVDALTRSESAPDAEELQLLVDAVGYAMQPVVAAHLRDRAEQLLATITPADRARYFDARRLAELGLPGAPAGTALQRLLRPAGGVGRVEEWRLTALGARRRVGRAWKAIRGR